MTASELIDLIPAELFRELAIETRVDHQAKKLSGELMFKLILFSMLSSDKLSLRVMEAFLHSAKFKSFTGYDILEGKYNSIRDRICTINAGYFEKLFQSIFSIYNKELGEEKALSKTDSTYVSLAAELFQCGMKNGNEGNGADRRFVKYSVNLKGSLPSSVKVFTDQAYVSEDLALAELIDGAGCLEGNVVVFDRGLQARSSFDRFTGSGKLFVSRAGTNIILKDAAQGSVGKEPEGATVTITGDATGFLVDKKHKRTGHRYRVIRGSIVATGEPICFVTNILDGDAYLMAERYRQRWEIEVFFRFIKQHLNVKHLVSRDENGIKVMLYMTMILAMLIIAYKKKNRIKGFKMAKLRFELELDNEMVRAIVVLCGGDPSRAPHIFKSG